MDSIPKIIWQTHNYEFSDLPKHFKKTAQTWINLNPGWEYRYVSHTDREEVVKKYPIFWQYYHSQKPVCQADMWRYIVTYEHGGVYADMDSICVSPLDYALHTVPDCEMIVRRPYIWWDYIEYRIARLKTKGLSPTEINYRLAFQKRRSGLQVYQLEALNMIHGYSTSNATYAIKKQSNIMKNIIEQSEKYLINEVSQDKQYTNLLGPFLDVVQGSKDGLVKPAESIKFEFRAAYHDDPYKIGFESNFDVDDYGTSIKYEDYLKKYNLPIF